MKKSFGFHSAAGVTIANAIVKEYPRWTSIKLTDTEKKMVDSLTENPLETDHTSTTMNGQPRVGIPTKMFKKLWDCSVQENNAPSYGRFQLFKSNSNDNDSDEKDVDKKMNVQK